MVLARILRTAPLWLAAAWVMGLTCLGFMVVPMLFAHLPSPALAGNMAAKLFAAQTGVSTVCALLLVVILRSDQHAAPAQLVPTLTMLALAGALLALLVEFGVTPHIVARDNLKVWHSVGSAMYFVQWLCALLVFGRLVNAAVAPQAESVQV